jgi:hypothetical protein
MEVICSSRTSSFIGVARRHNPEVRALDSHCREGLRSNALISPALKKKWRECGRTIHVSVRRVTSRGRKTCETLSCNIALEKAVVSQSEVHKLHGGVSS